MSYTWNNGKPIKLTREPGRDQPNKNEFYITEFYGGIVDGNCLQITFGQEYITLTKQEVVDLAMKLYNF